MMDMMSRKKEDADKKTVVAPTPLGATKSKGAGAVPGLKGARLSIAPKVGVLPLFRHCTSVVCM